MFGKVYFLQIFSTSNQHFSVYMNVHVQDARELASQTHQLYLKKKRKQKSRQSGSRHQDSELISSQSISLSCDLF